MSYDLTLGALSVTICFLIFWNLMLHSKIAELRQEIQKRQQWLDRGQTNRERI